MSGSLIRILPFWTNTLRGDIANHSFAITASDEAVLIPSFQKERGRDEETKHFYLLF